MLFCCCWSKESTSIKFCKHELGINKNTVVDWNIFAREVNATDLLANPVIIGGPNTTLEKHYTFPGSDVAILHPIIQRVSGSPMETFKPWGIPT